MLALVYLLFVTKHKPFVSAMSIVTHTHSTGNTSLNCVMLKTGAGCGIVFLIGDAENRLIKRAPDSAKRGLYF